MSIRFDNVADRLIRTSDVINYNAAYTVMAWIYLVSDLNIVSNFFALSDGTQQDTDQLGTNATGTVLRLRTVIANTATNVTGTDLSTGTWHHLTLVRESTTSLKAYVGGVLDATNTANVSTRDAAARIEIAGLLGNTQNYDGRIFAIKAWSNSLTQAEVQQEMRTVRPIRLSDLYAYWPCRPGSTERLKDYSGNGRDWTEAGALADEDHPPISWGIPIAFDPFVAAAPQPPSTGGFMTPMRGIWGP